MLTAYDITGEEFHHTREDVDTLHQLVKMVVGTGDAIVNIGACFGTSALAMIEAQPTATIFSVDVQACQVEMLNLSRAGIQPGRVIRILGRSQDVGHFWPILLPFIFVDGAHDAESVAGDINAWRAPIVRGGIMAFHDYGTPSLPHVKAVVDKMMDWEPVLHIGTIKAFRR